jgi:hypothetical protein
MRSRADPRGQTRGGGRRGCEFEFGLYDALRRNFEAEGNSRISGGVVRNAGVRYGGAMPQSHPIHESRLASSPRAQLATAGPQWARLPLPGHRCTYTDLTRTALENLCCPRRANNYRPPVRAYCNRARGAVRGVWYVHLPSLLAYIDDQADRQSQEYAKSMKQSDASPKVSDLKPAPSTAPDVCMVP